MNLRSCEKNPDPQFVWMPGPSRPRRLLVIAVMAGWLQSRAAATSIDLINQCLQIRDPTDSTRNGDSELYKLGNLQVLRLLALRNTNIWSKCCTSVYVLKFQVSSP